MKPEEIKAEKERCYKQIKEAENRLAEIRKICKHENTFVGDYQWAVGHICQAVICEYCGEVIGTPAGNWATQHGGMEI
jgi:ribosomal protein S27E